MSASVNSDRPVPPRPKPLPLQRTTSRLRGSPDGGEVDSIDIDSLSFSGKSGKASRESGESDVAMEDAQAPARPVIGKTKTEGFPSDSEGVDSNGQDSHGQRSTGEDWIRQLDENVEENNRTDHDMDRAESPYFIPNHNSWRRSGRGRSWGGRADGGRYFGIAERFSDKKHSDQDRSIIDDLTVENKELRRRLKRYEVPSSRHLNDQRLFEVTAYDSLSPDEHLQLHELLQKFAMGKDIAMSGKSDSVGRPVQNAKETYARNGDSSEGVNDSAYTSGAGSGPSKNGSNESTRPPPRLSDLRHSALSTRSERSRMKAVVKKLEEVFTGRDSAGTFNYDGPHVQGPVDTRPRQEDPYSDQAADKEEGAREAPIIADPRDLDQTNSSTESLVPTDQLPDQRPTHPTDLDPGRGQNSEQNMEYLHHLTALSPNVIDMQGRWVFLNLVANMAQVHSMSVSKSFIEKAIKTVSKNLQLSSDGQMVRWKGGSSSGGSSQGVEGDVQMNEGSSANSQDDQSMKPKARQGSDGSLGGASQPLSGSGSGSVPGASALGSNSVSMDSSNFHYKPLFARHVTSDSEQSCASWASDSVRGNVSSDDWGDSGGGYTGGSSLRKTSRIGPRVYYRNLPFCTDLTSSSSVEPSQSASPFDAERYTSHTLGVAAEEPERAPPHSREIFSESGMDDSEQPDDRAASRCSSRLTIYPSEPLSMSPRPTSPLPLKASGIGPITLEDNFVIFTETAYFTGVPPLAPRHIKSQRRELEPSALPPALFLPDSDDSDIDTSDDDGYADSSSDGNLAVMDEDSDSGLEPVGRLASLPDSPIDDESLPGLDENGAPVARLPSAIARNKAFLGNIRMNVESD